MAGGMRQFFSVAYSKLSSIKKCLSVLKTTWSVPWVPEFFRPCSIYPAGTWRDCHIASFNGGEWIFDEEVEMYSLLWQLTENNIDKVKLSIYSFGRPTRSWSKNGSIVLTLDLIWLHLVCNKWRTLVSLFLLTRTCVGPLTHDFLLRKHLDLVSYISMGWLRLLMSHVQPEKVVAVSSCLDVSLIVWISRSRDALAIHTVIHWNGVFITWDCKRAN